jgi:histone H3/H4
MEKLMQLVGKGWPKAPEEKKEEPVPEVKEIKEVKEKEKDYEPKKMEVDEPSTASDEEEEEEQSDNKAPDVSPAAPELAAVPVPEEKKEEVVIAPLPLPTEKVAVKKTNQSRGTVVTANRKRVYAPRGHRDPWLSSRRCRDMFKRAGCGSQTKESMELLRLVVNHITRDLTAKAALLASHSHRRTVELKDMEYAGRLQTGKPTYTSLVRVKKGNKSAGEKARDHVIRVTHLKM